MEIDLGRVTGDRVPLDRVYPARVFPEAGEEYRVIGDTVLAAVLRREPPRWGVAGRVTSTLELTCSRCLEPLSWPVDASFDLLYLPQRENTGAGEVEVDEDGLRVAYYREGVLDLGQLLREQFYLALPMKPLCSPDCRGLCPECGANLNDAPCECRPVWVDPRLAPLAGWRSDRKDQD